MMQLFLTAIGQVLLIGVLIGAGLPAIFAFGIRFLAYGAGGDAEVSHEKPHPLGTVLGYLCIAIVLAVILLGIAIIVSSGFGYHVSFEHIIPTFKKG
ncbi:hypothetical protein [Nigerium massiliense]|uniref:hypothetical protein n=1 Tax=Nigerium massiliense TaxID=1522317 RepID=UPI00058C29F7|nr:hypothetical protein [Nigerium massiliense]